MNDQANNQQQNGQSDGKPPVPPTPPQQSAGPVPTAPPGNTMPPGAVPASGTPTPGTPAPAAGVPFPESPISADPFSGITPPTGAPPTGTPPTGTPPEPEDTTPANFELGKLFPDKLDIQVPAHKLSFDEDNFLMLLAGSISLSRDEKKRIIDTIPKLKQSQIDELVRIFVEEKEKFALLSKKHVPQLEKLADQHFQDWLDLEASYKSEEKTANDNAEADEIRKQLGI
jgi:hypothetical protein